MLDFLSASVYEFIMCALEDASLPPYKGSTLRGALGHGLRRATCTTRDRDCSACLLKGKCVYSIIFESPTPPDAERMRLYPSVPHPYVLEPPEGEKTVFRRNDLLAFRLVLVGKAQEYFPYLVYSVIQMASGGLGAARAKFRLEKVRGLKPGIRKRPFVLFRQEENCLRPANTAIGARDVKRLSRRYTGARELTLRLVTPLRVRSQRRLATEIDFVLLVKNLLRRCISLQHFHCGGPPDLPVADLLNTARAVRVKESHLEWRDWQRFSSRQQRKMSLGGLVGEVTFAGESFAFLPLLLWGELLHVGRATGFGLGKYILIGSEGDVEQ